MAAMKIPAPHCICRQLTLIIICPEHAYGLCRALSPQTLNLAIPIHLIVLEHRELGLLALVLNLLRRSVHLLFPLLSAATEAEDQVQRALLLDVVVGERTAIFELLAGED